MAYSDFTLRKVKSELDINFIENESVFSHIKPVEISQYLQETLSAGHQHRKSAVGIDHHQYTICGLLVGPTQEEIAVIAFGPDRSSFSFQFLF